MASLERQVIWISTSLATKGGISTYVKNVRETPFWGDWKIRHIASHVDGSAPMKIAIFSQACAQAALRRRPILVHIHSSTRGSFLRKAILALIYRLRRVPTILHIHGSNFVDWYDSQALPMRKFARLTLSRAEVVYVLGVTLEDQIRQRFPDCNVRALNNGIASRRSEPVSQAGNRVHFVYIGRIGERKGAFRLLQAWKKYLGQAPDSENLQLTFAGDGQTERLRMAIEEMALGNSVAVHEWLSADGVGNLLENSHVLVLPSTHEGQPMAILEAMAKGLAIVTSPVGGIPDLLTSSESAVFVQPTDQQGLLESICRLASDAEERQRLGRSAWERSEDLLLDSIMMNVSCEYEAIVTRHDRSNRGLR